jgi:hypothetical protein
MKKAAGWFLATVSRLAAKLLSGGEDLECGRGNVATVT